jgi:hypothetical protein
MGNFLWAVLVSADGRVRSKVSPRSFFIAIILRVTGAQKVSSQGSVFHALAARAR